jgi:lipoyl(octanoyl) transferase
MVTRLIIDGPARGSWNMAVDESLLQSVEQTSESVLRFYEWNAATLSLGYFQQYASRDEHPSSSSLPVVRRATGGGAIVHDRELTYSFTTPIRNRFSSEGQELVRRFHESLLDTFAEFGIEASLCGETKSERTSEPFLCFQRRSCLDVLVSDCKVVGSAQRRHRGALLQHGSILLARSSAAESLPGLSELCTTAISPLDLASCWSRSLCQRLDFEFTTSELTQSELLMSDRIEADRFTRDGWTRRR